MEHVEINENANFEALLSDQAVMDWLLELEADDLDNSSSEAPKAYQA